MDKKPILLGNWKMNHTISEAVAFVNEFIPHLPAVNCEVGIAPSFTSLYALNQLHEGLFWLGAQDLYFEEKGAFTGQVSPGQIKDAGAQFVIIGHSERRHVFGETDEEVNKKVHAALREQIRPVLCVGETEEQREAGQTIDVVLSQLKKGFNEVDSRSAILSMVAYEPVWAIGTGKTATPEDAQKVHEAIREAMEQSWSKEVASQVPILYGGSVKPANIEELLQEKDIDGALIGGASLKASSMVEMMQKDI